MKCNLGDVEIGQVTVYSTQIDSSMTIIGGPTRCIARSIIKRATDLSCLCSSLVHFYKAQIVTVHEEDVVKD
jgi:hypothetical protein